MISNPLLCLGDTEPYEDVDQTMCGQDRGKLGSRKGS
jgi:hypothetical protein